MRCRRPQRACYCAHLVCLPTRTRVVILQHPRERDMPIGTAHMATLCLPNSELHVGVDWSRSSALQRALTDPERPAVLLYPGEGAADLKREPPPGPCTLVVLDGTWWQARKLLRSNPNLAALPRVAFVPEQPSEYRIRREPEETYVSTIEALAEVLPALEPGAAEGVFRMLLQPFRAMVDTQLECEATMPKVHGGPSRKRLKLRKNSLAKLRERAADVVCVTIEASAWARRHVARDGASGAVGAADATGAVAAMDAVGAVGAVGTVGTADATGAVGAVAAVDATRPGVEDELVYLVAHRPSDGSTLAVAVQPRHGLAPNTLSQTELPPDTLAAAVSHQELAARTRAFFRQSDAVCTWGNHAVRLAGALLPATRFDIRQIARDRAQGNVGPMREVLASLGGEPEPIPATEGRAGQRLAELVGVVRGLCGAGDAGTARSAGG